MSTGRTRRLGSRSRRGPAGSLTRPLMSPRPSRAQWRTTPHARHPGPAGMQAKAYEAASTSRKRRWGDDRAGLPVSERSGHDLDADAAVVRDRNRTTPVTRSSGASATARHSKQPCSDSRRSRPELPKPEHPPASRLDRFRRPVVAPRAIALATTRSSGSVPIGRAVDDRIRVHGAGAACRSSERCDDLGRPALAWPGPRSRVMKRT